MSKTIYLTTPLKDSDIEKLKTGDQVFISGVVFSARDAAHKRLIDLLDRGEELPFDIKGQIIYYVGPSPAKPRQVIGSAGPTTAYRMDPYAPRLMEIGMKGMIGKGARSREVRDAIKKYRCIYLGAIGGVGALLSKYIKSVELVAYEDLGTEAIVKMTVENFPTFVINDIYGNDLYEQGRERYKIES